MCTKNLWEEGYTLSTYFSPLGLLGKSIKHIISYNKAIKMSPSSYCPSIISISKNYNKTGRTKPKGGKKNGQWRIKTNLFSLIYFPPSSISKKNPYVLLRHNVWWNVISLAKTKIFEGYLEKTVIITSVKSGSWD